MFSMSPRTQVLLIAEIPDLRAREQSLNNGARYPSESGNGTESLGAIAQS